MLKLGAPNIQDGRTSSTTESGNGSCRFSSEFCEYSKSQSLLKTYFDGLRNSFVCATIFYTGIILVTLKLIDCSDFWQCTNDLGNILLILCGLVIFVTGIILFTLNTYSIFRTTQAALEERDLIRDEGHLKYVEILPCFLVIPICTGMVAVSAWMAVVTPSPS